MGAGHVQVAPDSTGKDVDADSVVSTEAGTPTVYRQNVILSDPTTYGAKAAVTNVAPANTAYGLVTRQIRAPLLGSFYFESGILAIAASAAASTAGFFWLINPVGSVVVIYMKKLLATTFPTAATAFVTSPRVTIERVTFTGTASGAQITPAKHDSTDAANVGSLRTASTGLTLTAGAVLGDFSVNAILTAVGIATPVDQIFFEATRDDDDLIVLRAGEGIVCRQADAGSTSDTRKIVISGQWEER
jgi:hypothetical protein